MLGKTSHVDIGPLSGAQAFHPLFWGGSIFALAAIALWIASYSGWVPNWAFAGGGVQWHRHEMAIGFTSIIIASVLLIAVQALADTPALAATPLGILFLLWFVARIAWFVPMPIKMLALLQVPFLPLLIWLLLRQLMVAHQRINHPIVLLLILFSGCQFLSLWGLASGDETLQRRGALAALWVIAAMIGIIGGRAIPFFTERELSQPYPIEAHPRKDLLGMLAAITIAALTATGLNQAPTPWLAALFLLVAFLHGWRLLRWRDRGVWAVPLLWSLHVAYAWMMVAALGMALWHLGYLSQPSLATHALTVGAMGGLTLSLLARIRSTRSRHSPKALNLAFVTFHLGAFCRVILTPFCSAGLWLSALLWILAFSIFLWQFLPFSLRSRTEGLLN